MTANWISRRCRVASAQVLAVVFVVAAITVALLAVDARYWRNFMDGPHPADPVELSKDPHRIEHVFVTVTGASFADSGIEEVTTNRHYGVETSADRVQYYVTPVGPRLLLVKSESAPSGTASGELRSLPPDLERLLVREQRDRFHGVYLDVHSFRLRGWCFIAMGAASLLTCCILGARAFRQVLAPETHPTALRVASWGDPREVAVAVAEEMKAPIAGSSGRVATATYLIDRSFCRAGVYRWEDLVWAYPKTLKGQHWAMLKFADGDCAVRGGGETVDLVLAHAASRAPWAIHTYSLSTAVAWWTHRRTLVEEVGRRLAAAPRSAAEA